MKAHSQIFIAGLLVALGFAPAWAKSDKKSGELRAQYLARVQQQPVSVDDRTLGSLWKDSGSLTRLASDYKARTLNDTVIIQVSVLTAASSAGDLTAQRSFQTQSAVTGLPFGLSTNHVNPLLAAQSAEQTKGQGQADNNSSLTTSLAAQVIAVLPNGNLVLEAQRLINMNNQKETMVVRGIARPNDIATDDTIPSAALTSLEIELKGKGVISDSVRPPNALMRFLMKILNF